jgi:E3 ubiquitin-protein ligase HUWE1
VNPLLQRNGRGTASRDASSQPPVIGGWIRAVPVPQDGSGASFADFIGSLGGRPPFGESPAGAALLDEFMRSLPHIPGTIARNGGALQFHFTANPGHEIPRDLQGLQSTLSMLATTRSSRIETRRDNGEPGSTALFTPQSTAHRWMEEAKLLFGGAYHLKAADLGDAILAVLVPPAISVDRTMRAAEAERVRKQEEEIKKRQEEERLAKEAKEAEEKIEKEKKEAEEREAAERAAEAELAAQETNELFGNITGEAQGSNAAEAMDGIETEAAQPSGDSEATPQVAAEDRPRVMTTIRGTPFDITDLGIDADFLTELPEDIREEVIMSTVAGRRSQAAATGAQPSEIDQEFLDALPEDIRDEIVQQERQDRRRREREEQRRQATAGGGGPAAPDMDAASILATLTPALRNQILAEQDEEMLNQLPPDLAEQARAAQREFPVHHGRAPGGLARRLPPPDIEGREVITPRPPRRAIVQMLDKPGIATLLRLMFVIQQGTLRSTLNSVLENVSLNRHNRTEVLGTLLHILENGSIDMTAVERSFAQLSLRAKLPKEIQPKTPTPLKRSLTWNGMGSLTQANPEISPIVVVQQCLAALGFLTGINPHVPTYFLTEHDTGASLKRNLSKKGKGKEPKDTKAGRYPLNSLLTLLDRDLIMENSAVMESLSTLLNMVTQPLQALQRKQKEAEEAAKKDAEELEDKTEASTSAVESAAPTSAANAETTTTSNEQQPVERIISVEPSSIETTQPPINSDTANNGEGIGPGITEKETKQPETLTEESEKKPRPVTFPVTPQQNLKLVINIFVARECSSRTFRETLSTIKNLSTIPGAKAVFGRELIAKAQGLGEVILKDLEELLPQIEKATSGTEIQGVALAKFSPGGSDQNKLLRVLTALDHLFDPKREKRDKPAAESDGESSQLSEKQDLLSSLYENSTFGPMWEKLSACLSAIRQREHLLNVATILLPLIEALMVVCKNTTLKDAPLARTQIGKEMLLTSPPPESRMENLFFSFTEEHRKILNELVRHNPKLMSGTFSLLVKNPKVLEFDNKRNYFSRSIHNKNSANRQAFPPLQLSVRRDQVFHDSFKSLYFQTGDQMKHGKLSIRFHGEEGVDAGGVTREWFQVLSRQMFDPGYALFIPVSSDRTTFHPNQLSSVNEEHLLFFKFIGRIIGKALYEGRVLDCHFSRAVYKRILGKAVSVKDMESLDPDYYKSLVWMLENDITDIITETFSVDNDKFGVIETIDFIPNGRNIAVTELNKQEYVRLMVEWKLTGSVKEQLDQFLKGKFSSIARRSTLTYQVSMISFPRISSQYLMSKNWSY